MTPRAADTGSTGFARWWTERVADLADVVPGGPAGLAAAVVLLAGLVVALLYWWPHRRLLRRDRRRGGRDSRPEPDRAPDEDDSPDELPDRPSAELRSLADRYRAQGRHAEAVRERLRAMVRTLVDDGVLTPVPGATVTELAAGVGTARPPLAAPMTEASTIFSDIWYGQRPATVAHDDRMRTLAAALRQRRVGR